MDASRTRHASEALHLSDLINVKFAGNRYGTEVQRSLRVTEPDGPSTDGGRKARQAILLQHPTDERRNLICGFINSAKRFCEVRSFQVVSEAHRRRHEEAVDISSGEYRRFTSDLKAFLEAHNFEFRIENAPVRPRAPSTVRPTPAPIPATPSASASILQLFLAYALGALSCYLVLQLLG